MSACSAAFERFQPIARKDRQIRKGARSVNLGQPSLNYMPKPVEALRISTVKNQFRISGSKRSNH